MEYKSLKAHEVREGHTIEYCPAAGIYERGRVAAAATVGEFVKFTLEGRLETVRLHIDTLLNTWI